MIIKNNLAKYYGKPYPRTFIPCEFFKIQDEIRRNGPVVAGKEPVN
jgi:hypothetical protein